MDAIFESLKEKNPIEKTCCFDLVKTDEYMICRKCFACYPYLVDDKFVYGERIINNVYVPATYMKTKLNEFLGFVDLTIPIHLFKCKTISEIFQTMKKNKLNNYDQVYRIAKELNLPYPIMSRVEQEQILFLFNQIRVKFPYTFILSKLLEKVRPDLVHFVYQPRNKKRLDHYEKLYLEK